MNTQITRKDNRSQVLRDLERATKADLPSMNEHESVIAGLQHCGCSRAGAEAVLSIVDPSGVNHVPDDRARGYPSSDGTRSNVFTVRGYYPIDNLSENGHTSIGVIFSPCQNIYDTDSAVFAHYDELTGGLSATGVAQATYPGTGLVARSNPLTDSLVTVYKKQTSKKFWDPLDGLADVYNASNTPSLDFRQYMPISRKSRLVGGYLKIEDLTPPIYQTGTITPFRMKSEVTDVNAAFYKAGVGATDVSWVRSHSGPPSSSDEAMRLGANQWPLREGGLITLAPTGFNTVSEPRGFRLGMETNGSAPIGLGGHQGLIDSVSISTAYPYSKTTVSGMPIHKEFLGFDTQGLYMDGLTSNSVIRLNWVLRFEVFPEPGDDTMTLAKSALATDPVAIRMMEEIFRELPMGSPAHENGLGDWFRRVTHVVKNLVLTYGPTAASIVTAIRPEFGPAASAAVAALKLSKNSSRSKRKNKA